LSQMNSALDKVKNIYDEDSRATDTVESKKKPLEESKKPVDADVVKKDQNSVLKVMVRRSTHIYNVYIYNIIYIYIYLYIHIYVATYSTLYINVYLYKYIMFYPVRILFIFYYTLAF
jgi:hypothetical protein